MMGEIGMTERQADVALFMQANPGASYRKIAEGAGLSHKGAAYQIVSRLADRGWARQPKGRAAELTREVPAKLWAPKPPAHFGTDPRAGRPTAYTGPYPIRSGRTCADWSAQEMDEA